MTLVIIRMAAASGMYYSYTLLWLVLGKCRLWVSGDSGQDPILLYAVPWLAMCLSHHGLLQDACSIFTAVKLAGLCHHGS